MPGPSGKFMSKSPFEVTFPRTPSPSTGPRSLCEYTELWTASYLGECPACRLASGCSPQLVRVFPPLSVVSLIDGVESGACWGPVFEC